MFQKRLFNETLKKEFCWKFSDLKTFFDENQINLNAV